MICTGALMGFFGSDSEESDSEELDSDSSDDGEAFFWVPLAALAFVFFI